ncbi:MAG: lysoplasmalogenase [Endozoicomonas sp.]
MPKSVSLLFWGLSLAYLLLLDHLPLEAGVVAKATPVVLLMVPVWNQLKGKLRVGMLVALLFSAGGDVFLALDDALGDFFIPGLGSFLVAQLTYSVLFWSDRTSDVNRKWLALGFLPAALLLAGAILPATEELLIPVMIYLLAVCSMVMGAAFCNRPWQWMFVGAATFAVSDSLIAINKFLFPIPYATVLIMFTYYLAQYLIVTGMLKQGGRAP